jgi:tetratricopeptide (TPR) repeat protein
VASDGVQPERIARVLQHADDGHVADALIKAEALAAEYPLNANVHRLVALLFEDAKKIEEALLAWRRVLYLAPDDVDAHLRVGLLLGRMGDRAGATRALRNAVVARERRKLRKEQDKAAGQGTEDDGTVDVAGRLLRKIRGESS